MSDLNLGAGESITLKQGYIDHDLTINNTVRSGGTITEILAKLEPKSVNAGSWSCNASSTQAHQSVSDSFSGNKTLSAFQTPDGIPGYICSLSISMNTGYSWDGSPTRFGGSSVATKVYGVDAKGNKTLLTSTGGTINMLLYNYDSYYIETSGSSSHQASYPASCWCSTTITAQYLVYEE